MTEYFERNEHAIVTTRSGRTFEAVWTLAPGIDYFWNPVEDIDVNYMIDPVVSARRLS